MDLRIGEHLVIENVKRIGDYIVSNENEDKIVTTER